MAKITLYNDGESFQVELVAPKVKHLADITAKSRESKLGEVAMLGVALEVLSNGELTADEFLDSDAVNLQIASDFLAPFLSSHT